MMKILCYANLEKGIDHDVRQKIEDIATQDQTQLFYDLTAFCLRVEECDIAKTIVVICPADRLEYDWLMEHQQKLHKMFVILVQPDQEPIACLSQPLGRRPAGGRPAHLSKLTAAAH